MKNIQLKNSVKSRRINCGNITQSELAQKVGVTRQTLHLIEHQKYNPSIKVCLLIADALNTTIEKLFWMEEK